MSGIEQTDTISMKQQAKRLRSVLAETGQPISHAQALEAVARQHGFRDWNTAVATAPIAPATPAQESNVLRLMPGERVQGLYMGQPFRGEVRSVNILSRDRLNRISIEFDEAVDVVTFESFSAFRKRVACQIGPDGISPQKRSDGTPHMRIAHESGR